MTKRRWRRAWFQIHKWIGLALAILVVPLGLSGTALVYGEALDGVVNPQRHATSGTARLTPDAYAAAAAARLPPGGRVAQLRWPEGDGPVIVTAAGVAASTRPGPPLRTLIWLDPPTARVLDRGSSDAGWMRFVHVLHGSLQIPAVGRIVVGLIGVAMMVSAVTGLWLWWPATGSALRGLRWRRRPGVIANLHHLLGFWVALPFLALSLTGAWIAFPITGGAKREPDRSAQARARPVAATRLTAAAASARAAALLPGMVRSITWPTERKPDWSVQIGVGRGRTVVVADDGAVAALAREPAVPGGAMQLVRGMHEGSVGGSLWRLVMFLTGLVPAVLAATGVVMWWRARSGIQRKLYAVAERATAGAF